MSAVPADCPQLFGVREPDDWGCAAGASLRLGVCLQCSRGRPPAPIRNDVEYAEALEEVSRLFCATEDPALARLIAIVEHIEAYEAVHYPIRAFKIGREASERG